MTHTFTLQSEKKKNDIFRNLSTIKITSQCTNCTSLWLYFEHKENTSIFDTQHNLIDWRIHRHVKIIMLIKPSVTWRKIFSECPLPYRTQWGKYCKLTWYWLTHLWARFIPDPLYLGISCDPFAWGLDHHVSSWIIT